MRSAKLFALALLIGCSDGIGPQGSERATFPGVGDEFTLRIGETTTIEGADLEIRFLAVSEDSRCPANALILCVWIGDGAAVIETETGAGDVSRDTLHTTLDPKAVDRGPVRLTLVQLDPYPEDVGAIPAEEYVATFSTQMP
jgi:hypothetical protein